VIFGFSRGGSLAPKGNRLPSSHHRSVFGVKCHHNRLRSHHYVIRFPREANKSLVPVYSLNDVLTFQTPHVPKVNVAFFFINSYSGFTSKEKLGTNLRK